eukprot:NODE_211_length_14581_cov_0.368941.p1 type:complete len:1949 gc:universal NODE_211_length_14581_cov_0.368941:9406-3560(-)
MQQYCDSKKGKKAIKRILIANNGIAAVKCIRSIRQWSYEQFSEDAVELIVMASDDDLKVNAEFIKIADQYVKVIGGGNVDNYANVHLIIEIAKQYNVDAVWPGWGHASENPFLPERLSKEGILFIGPNATAMRALGDKIGSMILAQSAGVPCIPWNGKDIHIENISDIDLYYNEASIKSVQHCQDWCDRIGYPSMIKASEGGGGKGIRKVLDSSQVPEMYSQVKAELPGSPIFVMKTAVNVRHVEVQLLSDEYGDSISVFSRDCSVQRRHQKIIEEAPAVIVPVNVISKMEKCAVKLARMVGYRSAGTVEYLYDPNSNEFYFLELNPRLQVEHPCTEMITGLNLLACQVQVAMGIPLTKIPDIVKFLKIDSDDFDLYASNIYPKPLCHVISARITAENPDKGFLPSSGTMSQLSFKSRNNVWGYFSVDSKGGLHEFADSQFGHVFSQGATRDEARINLIVALRELSIQSEFRTSVAYLVKLMETQAFIQNNYNTEWLDDLLKHQRIKTFNDEFTAVLYGSVYYFYIKFKQRDEYFVNDLKRGKLPKKALFKRDCEFQCVINNVGYKLQGFECEATKIKLVLNNSYMIVDFVELADGGLLISDGFNSNTVYGRDFSSCLEVSFRNQIFTLEMNYDKSTVKSIGSGKITKWCISDGQHVVKGDVICYMEVMKMISPIFSPKSGSLQILENEGASIIANQPICKFTNHVDNEELTFFNGQFPKISRPGSPNDTCIGVFNDMTRQITNIMSGYHPEADVGLTCSVYLSLFARYELPFDMIKQHLLLLEGRIPNIDLIMNHITQSEHDNLDFPSVKLIELLSDNANAAKPLLLAKKFRNGRASYEMDCVGDLFHDFCTDVEFFTNLHSNNDILESLKRKYPNDYNKWLSVLWKHHYTTWTMELISCLLDLLKSEKSISILNKHFIDEIKELAYNTRIDQSISIKAKELLLYCQVPTWSQKVTQLQQYLNELMNSNNPSELLVSLVESPCCILDLLVEFALNEPFIKHCCLMCFIAKTVGPATRTSVLSEDVLTFSKEDIEGRIVVASVKHLSDQLNEFNNDRINLIYVILDDIYGYTDEEWSKLLVQYTWNTRITFIIYKSKSFLKYFTFKNKVEDIVIRNVEPGLVVDLELSRFVNFTINPLFYDNVKCQVYHAIAKDNKNDERIFIRYVTHTFDNDINHSIDIKSFLLNHGRQMLAVMLNVMEIASIAHPNSNHNHLFVVFKPIFMLEITVIELELTKFIKQHGVLFRKLKITTSEIIFTVITSEYSEPQSCRFIASDEDGLNIKMIINNTAIKEPYLPITAIQSNRAKAISMNTIYIHDIPSIISRSVAELNGSLESVLYLQVINDQVVESTTFIPATIAMVAYKFIYKSPEAPQGRSVIVIANDICNNYGSFSVLESQYFYRISEYCRKYRLPRIYFSCNSGARVGVVDSIIPYLQVKLVNNQIQYLYITSENYLFLKLNSPDILQDVVFEQLENEQRIKSVVGTNIGVENLSASGLIASETFECYNECFTVSIVSCRSVGIGAYLSRLASRVIQKKDSCILLTGKDALNKLLQNKVYNNNLQLGGPEVMYSNGTSHLIVNTDQDAFNKALKWIQYVPLTMGELAPRLVTDSRTTLDKYDYSNIRASICSVEYDGLLDKGSFMETCGGWAKTIIIGRGRLMGYPIGVITSDSIKSESYIPADPAQLASSERCVSEAAHVFYPNGAYKTAEAIKDFNHEGLPLLILANWRGFSGGQTDMYNMVLKFGSMIVEQLQQYKQPVIIYILPNGELRGGSWVVLDSSINKEQISIFADKTSKGNILEPQGLAAIKLRNEKQLQLYNSMFDKGAVKIPQAQTSLVLQIAEYYAGLHDTPERMMQMKVIDDIVEWEDCRRYFGAFLEMALLKEHYYRYYKRMYDKFELNTNVKKSEVLNKIQGDLKDVNKCEEILYDMVVREIKQKVEYLQRAIKVM